MMVLIGTAFRRGIRDDTTTYLLPDDTAGDSSASAGTTTRGARFAGAGKLVFVGSIGEGDFTISAGQSKPGIDTAAVSSPS